MISPTSGSYSTASFFEGPIKGINRGISKLNVASENIANGDVSAENMVDLMQSEKLVKASTVALRTQDDVIGSLLNVKV